MANGQIYKLLGKINSDLINPDKLIFNAVLGAGSFPAEIGKQYIVIAHTFYTNGNYLKPSGAIVNRIYHDMVYSGEYQADYYALITATSDKVDFGYTEWGAVYWIPIN